jgi:hypothetical protein
LLVVFLVAVAIVAFVADGHSVSGTKAQKLEAWISANGVGQQIGTLTDTAADVVKAARQKKTSGVFHSICGVMATDAQTYNDDLPAPDLKVSHDLAQAYTDAYDAGEACYRSGGSNHTLLEQSETTSKKANALFDAALQRVAQVTKHTVSTTTTTGVTTTATGFF